MDPLSALSLAGTVVQFVDFGSKLFLESRALYRSTTGSLAPNDELDLITSDLHELLSKFRQSFHLTTQPSDSTSKGQDIRNSFETLCDEAIEIAKEIIKRLDGLKVIGKHRVWKSVRQAVKSAWSQGEISGLVSRLSSLKEALETRVLFSLRDHLDILSIRISDRFDKLDLQTQQIVTALVGTRQTLTTGLEDEVRDQTRALAQMLSRLGERSQHENSNRPRTGSSDGKAPFNHTFSGTVIPIAEILETRHADEWLLRTSIEDSIVESLEFPMMTTRYEEVPKAYESTFEWIFCDPRMEGPSDNFVNWLMIGTGVYWMNGKAGSGKSTLMKSIYNDVRTRQHLQTWAGDTPLCITSFFFWNSGTPEQKSQSGLLKALLFDALSQRRELIPVVLPVHWARAYSQVLDANKNAVARHWSLQQLKTAFRNLVEQTIVPLKLCLFIDGLDEFDGDHDEITELFKSISISPNVKCCLSSRPWIVFEEHFQDCKSLRLQDLTHNDIQHYVTHKLHGSNVFKVLAEKEPKSAPALIQEVVEKADGVFLWVKLVVKSLLDGIRNRDTIPDLEKRLCLLPRELGPLYEHLLSLIDPLYLEWASKVFQIMRAARNHRNDLGGIQESPPPLTILAFFLAINEDSEGTTNQNVAAFQENCEHTKFQLTARCAGLLEVWEPNPWNRGSKPIVSQPIIWLHRTARDFIERVDIWNRLQTITAGTSFDPNGSMLKSCVLQLKISRIEGNYRWLPLGYMLDSFDFLVTSALLYAHHADVRTHEARIDLLDELAVIMRTPFIRNANQDEHSMNDSYQEHWYRWKDHIARRGSRWPWADDIKIAKEEKFQNNEFMKIAVTYGLTAYVRKQLETGVPGSPTNGGKYASLLHYVPTLEDNEESFLYPPPRPEMVEMLLRFGGDPNAEYYGLPSAWKRALHCMARFQPEGRANLEEQLDYMRIVLLFIRAGADPYARLLWENVQDDWDVTSTRTSRTAVEILTTVRSAYFPAEIAELSKELRARVPPSSANKREIAYHRRGRKRHWRRPRRYNFGA